MILVLVTHDGGAIEETAFQALSFAGSLASELDTDLHAAWVGDGPEADRLGAYGVSTVYHVAHEALDDYAPRAWGAAVSQLVEELSPVAVVAVGSDRGNEVMAHVGAILGEPMVANVRQVTPGDGVWGITRTR